MTNITKPKHIILVSPAPLDGYPPVQNQAKLLAEAGYSITVLTSYLYHFKEVTFSQKSVSVIAFALSNSNLFERQINKLRFLLRLILLRLRLQPVCEISYDPEGLFFSRLCPFKPKTIIGHLHEVLFEPDKRFFEKFAVPFLHKVSLVVVPDSDRAALLVRQINLTKMPIVVRNLPLPKMAEQKPSTCDKAIFSVVYHGSVGFSQALDTVIRSIPYWPETVTLHIYGVPSNTKRAQLEGIAKNIDVLDRVFFEGWISFEKIIHTISQHSVGLSLLRPENDNWRFSAGASNKRYQLMQAGLPQITDDGEEVRKFIEGDGVGICVSPEDPYAIANAVNFFYTNRALCKEIGEKAIHLIETKYRYDYEFQSIVNYIERI